MQPENRRAYNDLQESFDYRGFPWGFMEAWGPENGLACFGFLVRTIEIFFGLGPSGALELLLR